jgi:hypothetical protein
MHTLLRPVAIGMTPHPWTLTALPFLLVSSALCAAFYSPSFLRGTGVSVQDLFWIQRVDARTDRDFSANLMTGQELSVVAPSYKSQLFRASVEVFVAHIWCK